MPAQMVEVDERRRGPEVVIASSTPWSITGAVGVAIATFSSAASSAAASSLRHQTLRLP